MAVAKHNILVETRGLRILVGWVSMHSSGRPLDVSETRRDPMYGYDVLYLLTKWLSSGSSGCPSVYTTDDPEMLVIQGHVLDADTRARLINPLDGEDAVAIPTETILRAADMIRARQ
jgi:hypothetical protein